MPHQREAPSRRPRWDVFLVLLVVPIALFLGLNSMLAGCLQHARCTDVTHARTLTFQVGAGLVAVILVATYVIAIGRRASWVYLWHLLMTAAVVVMLLAVAVPKVVDLPF